MLRDTLSNAWDGLALLKYLHCQIDTYQTTKGISAAIASSMPAAARGGLGGALVQFLLPMRLSILRYKDS